MAKGKYQQWLTEEGLLKIESWARHGLTDAELAKNMGISRSTLNEWRNKFSDISDAIKSGREITDILVENALFKRALGYQEEVPEITVETTEKDGTKTTHTRRVKKVYPPDTGAAIFLLKNRYKEHYQERPKLKDEQESIRLENELKRLEIINLESSTKGIAGQSYTGIPVTMIAPVFSQLMFDIQNKKYEEFVLPGGRGSSKSSFISLAIIDLIEKNPTFHAVVTRQVGNTLSTSCFTQMKWAINELGLTDEYRVTKHPMEITKKSTNQKIYFLGSDDPSKFKSIKPEFGHIAILWFEELDQFHGEEATRKIEQSVIRGDDVAYIFKSFNPPRSRNNWANKYILQNYPKMHVYNSCYKDVPKEWLGEPFISRAEWIKETNPVVYENEYLGVANGSGGNIFENITEREITDEEIARFDRIYNGLDWGWYPDPTHFIRCAYEPAQQTIYLLDEFRCNKTKNADLAEMVKARINEGEAVVCDSAEKKSVAEFRELGVNAYPARKGPGSRDYKAKWFASQLSIVYDRRRTPISGEELISMEYARDKNGELITGIPDGNDHAFDAMGYAFEQVMTFNRSGVYAV